MVCTRQSINKYSYYKYLTLYIGRARGVPPAYLPHVPVNPVDYGGVCPGHGSDDLIEVLIRILSVNLIQNLSVNLSRFLSENLSEIISESISGSLSENLSGIIPGYYFHHSGLPSMLPTPLPNRQPTGSTPHVTPKIITNFYKFL
jgi:hypothetical protein